jgi:hypothetical protein
MKNPYDCHRGTERTEKIGSVPVNTNRFIQSVMRCVMHIFIINNSLCALCLCGKYLDLYFLCGVSIDESIGIVRIDVQRPAYASGGFELLQRR